ncbi:alpha/beta hydrolase [Rhizobium sp. SG2393]|uniref:alpha/beta hydrolase n=1 Tax=Rhizobium sp. SG2393 TaxID=3276279 RepID=UPI00366B9CF5
MTAVTTVFKRLTLVIASAALLYACAGRPEGVLIPNGTAPGASEVNLLVATTRAPSTEPGVLFGGDRGDQISVASIVVSIPPDQNRKIGQVQWPQTLPADPRKEFSTVSVTPLDDDTGVNLWAKDNIPKSRRMLIFVHGFNNRYEDAVYRFAQIVHDSKADVAPVLFTWPSRASVFDYVYDRESTNYSRDALEDLLRKAANSPKVGEITVMAHSMGTWLAMESLRQMAIRDGRVAPKIRNVILASPDIDVDVVAKQWEQMGRDKPHFTIFVSRDDRALAASRIIAGDIDRLGQIDPTVEPYRSALEQRGITVFDLTDLDSDDDLNHGKFAESPEVVKLIGNRLIAGQTITDSNIGLGDRLGAVALGAAQTVGTAASVAVSTPILVFDPKTRENYDEQWQRLGRSVQNTVGTTGTHVKAKPQP